MVSYGQAVASWNQYSDANNLTPEQKQAGLDKLAKGELPEGANISKVIVDGYKDGVLIAGHGIWDLLRQQVKFLVAGFLDWRPIVVIRSMV